MSDFLDLPTLIAIGVAIFVLLRLRATLGTRTGTERKPSERPSSKNGASESPLENATDNVVQMRPHEAELDQEDDHHVRKLKAESERLSHGDDEIAKSLVAIGLVDTGFLPKIFMEGAKSAYEMIVTAFAAGDRKSLKILLEKDVYEGFDTAIAAREALDHVVDFTFVGLPGVEISDAELENHVASITIQFKAEVVSATRDSEGELVEGNGDQVMTISDEWTFARNTRSRDPNWKLVATNQLD